MKNFVCGLLCKWDPRTGNTYDVRICGIASNGVPILGKTWIVELLTPIKDWPWTHAVALERDLTVGT